MMYSGGMSDEARNARKNRSLLKTEGTGWDVGAAVRFLAGDEARWMTGECWYIRIRFDGDADGVDNRRGITSRCRRNLRNGD